MIDLSSGQRRFVYACIGVFIAYSAFLSLGSLEGFPEGFRVDENMPYLSDKPVGEDGHYMLTVAWNTSKGDFFAYNYGKTTGIQPLGTLVYSCIAWIVQQSGGDKWSFIRSVIFFSSILYVLFALIIGYISGSFFEKHRYSNTAFIVGFCFTIFNFAIFRHFTYGLEVSFYLIMIGVCVFWTMNRDYISLNESVVFGVLVGVTGLVRIDFGVVFAILVAIFFLQRRISLAGGIASGSIALAIVSPWFLWVHSVTGSWLPSSGAAQGSLISASNSIERISAIFAAIVNHMTPWAYPGGRTLLEIMAAASLVAAVVLIYTLRSSSNDRKIDEHRISACKAWAIATGALVIIYPTFFWATHFYGRYTTPLVVVLLPAMAVAVTGGLRAKYISWVFRLLVPGLVICFCVWAYISLHAGRVTHPTAVTAHYIHQEFDEDTKMGVYQSGIIGYHWESVLNLDGKINSNAPKYIKKYGMREYLNKRSIDVVIGKGGVGKIERLVLESQKWARCGMGNVAEFSCAKRVR
jgi:hypothetical protein